MSRPPDHVNPRSGETATHSLPLGNGYSSHWSSETGQEPPRTYCGRCREYFPVDAEWANAYHGRRLARLEHENVRGYLSPRELEAGRANIEADRQGLLRQISEAST